MMKSASLDGKLNNMDKIFSKDRKRSEIFKIIKLNKLSGKKQMDIINNGHLEKEIIKKNLKTRLGN